MKSNDIVYPGKDLEAMSFAANYHRWLLDEFRPYIGRRVVEVGAGTGSFSKMLLELGPASLTVIEPSSMYEELVRNIQGDGRAEVVHYNSTFEAVAARIKADIQPDTIIYVNVLEHIEDDVRELELVYESLDPGGRLLIFVPAVRALYSNFDRSIGHFRRYAKRQLTGKVRHAGFKIAMVKNFDAAGVLPWFVKYRLLRSKRLDQRSVRFYDNFVVPVASRLEPLLHVPIGKNVLLVAER